MQPSATFALNASSTMLGGFTIDVEGTIAGSFGQSLSSILTAQGAATFGISQGYVNNTKYPESISVALSLASSSASEFLWTVDPESTDTWTDQTESSDTWTDQTETSTTWTTQYPS